MPSTTLAELDREIAAAERDYDRAMHARRCVGLDQAGVRLRVLYARRRRLEQQQQQREATSA